MSNNPLEKLRIAEERLKVFKDKRCIAVLDKSNWVEYKGKSLYIGEDYDIDVELIKDYICLLKKELETYI